MTVMIGCHSLSAPEVVATHASIEEVDFVLLHTKKQMDRLFRLLQSTTDHYKRARTRYVLQRLTRQQENLTTAQAILRERLK